MKRSKIHDLLLFLKDESVAGEIKKWAYQQKYNFEMAPSARDIISVLERKTFRVLVLDLTDAMALQVIEWAKSLAILPEIIVVAPLALEAEAQRTLKMGVFDYQCFPPFDWDKWNFRIKSALEKFEIKNRIECFQEDFLPEQASQLLIGKSSAMLAIYEMIRTVAGSDSTILIQGDSGTGKEMVAKAIHRNSLRRDRPFVVINCSALPETLLEAELFGYTKGSFTGAINDKPGLFETGGGGTVFLDEIGEVPLSIQVKLLRVIQEGEIRRLGDTSVRKINVRIMSATNRDLQNLIAQGKFREDLYYRLNVINFHLPKLSERREDIPVLANHFVSVISQRSSQAPKKIAVDALEVLKSYGWPGNVRELENVIERAVVLSQSDVITAKNLPAKILSSSFYSPQSDKEVLSQFNYKEAKKRALNIFNRSYIIEILNKSNGNITAAAERAGMDRSNFKKIIKKYKIQMPLSE